MLYGDPIEKYVGLTDLSSYFISNISGVIPHLRKHFFLNILPRNQWIDLCRFSYIMDITNYNNTLLGALNEI